MSEDLSVGDWVEAVVWYEARVNPGFGIRPYNAMHRHREDFLPEHRSAARPVRWRAKVVAVSGDTVTVERWESAQGTRQRKAFGQPIDHSPYRVGGTYDIEAGQVKRVLYPNEAALAEQRHTAIMRLPTHGQRRYRREKKSTTRRSPS